jgi:hypothetical protein
MTPYSCSLRALVIVTAGALAAGCAIEQTSADLLSAGSYHGVSLYFELNPDDRPYAGGSQSLAQWAEKNVEPNPERKPFVEDTWTVAKWMDEIGRLPPLFFTIERGGREVYRVGNLHQVAYAYRAFEVGGHRYEAKPGAHLYVYKRRDGDFEFLFHEQRIVVPSDISWIPSVYRYALEETAPGGRVLTKEIVQVGFASIETVPSEGAWLVNGRRFSPDPDRTLTLRDANHATIAR